MKQATNNLISRLAYAQAAAVGAASGHGSRSRTILSRRDKAQCPRRQRKDRSWQREVM